MRAPVRCVAGGLPAVLAHNQGITEVLVPAGKPARVSRADMGRDPQSTDVDVTARDARNVTARDTLLNLGCPWATALTCPLLSALAGDRETADVSDSGYSRAVQHRVRALAEERACSIAPLKPAEEPRGRARGPTSEPCSCLSAADTDTAPAAVGTLPAGCRNCLLPATLPSEHDAAHFTLLPSVAQEQDPVVPERVSASDIPALV